MANFPQYLPPSDLPPPLPPSDMPPAPPETVVKGLKGQILVWDGMKGKYKEIELTYRGDKLSPENHKASFNKVFQFLKENKERVSGLTGLHLGKGGIVGTDTQGKDQVIKFNVKELRKIIKEEVHGPSWTDKIANRWEQFMDVVGGKDHRISSLERDLKKLCRGELPVSTKSVPFDTIVSTPHLYKEFRNLLQDMREEIGSNKLSDQFNDKLTKFETALTTVIVGQEEKKSLKSLPTLPKNMTDRDNLLRLKKQEEGRKNWLNWNYDEVMPFLDNIMTSAGLPRRTR